MANSFEPQDFYFWFVSIGGVLEYSPDYYPEQPLSDKWAYLKKVYEGRAVIGSVTVAIAWILWLLFMTQTRLQK